MEYAKYSLGFQGSEIQKRGVIVKATFSIKGFSDLIEELAKKKKDVEPIARRALQESADITQQAINNAAAVHNASGEMIAAEITPAVETIDRYSMRVRVGFNNNGAGGLHAIFLNYGTPKRKTHGTVDATHFFDEAIKSTAGKRRAIQKQIIKDVAK